jgi:6-phosphogluconolactonase (cycloisomerase 2 family)
MVAGAALVLAFALPVGPAHGFGFRGCLSGDGAGPCTSIANTNALHGVNAVTLSPDGKQLYSAAAAGQTIAAFAVDPLTGALGFSQCFGGTADGPCTSITNTNALSLAWSTVVSPDGTSLYAAAALGNAIASFTRDPATGALTIQGCVGATSTGPCTSISNTNALHTPYALAMSPDGKQLYVAASAGNAIGVFNRDPGTGGLTFAGCVGLTTAGPCTAIDNDVALKQPEGLAMSPDGKQLYVAASAGNAIGVFNRNTSTGEIAYAGCVGTGPTTCTDVHSFAAYFPRGLAISPDGKYLYSAAALGNTIGVFTRDTSTGVIAFASCVSALASGPCSGIANSAALASPRPLAMSPDGARLFVGAYDGDAVSVFTRDPGSGALTFGRCISRTGDGPCASLNGNSQALDRPFGLAVSADGNHVYSADAGGAISAFALQPVECSPVHVSTRVATAAQIHLGCADPDGGEALSYQPGAPAHGQLGAVDPQAGTVLYAPDPGFTGTDGFDVGATDFEGSATAHVTIDVTAAGASEPDTTPPQLAASLSRSRFRVGRRATAVSARSTPAGTRLQWRVSEPATIRAAFNRTVGGRRVGGHCVKQTRRNRSARPCRRMVAEGVLTRSAALGAGGLAFSGRVGRRALRLGRHRVVLIATDQAGNRSASVALAFRIVRR